VICLKINVLLNVWLYFQKGILGGIEIEWPEKPKETGKYLNKEYIR
jgi:hypothetical protein